MNSVCFTFCVSLLIGAAALSSASAPSSLSSTEANYDGNALILKGQVVLDHGLGKMCAEEAVLEKQEAGKEFPFSSIQLKKDVRLALRQSAQIVCEQAFLDFTSLKGTLLPSEAQKVVYTDLIQRKRGDPIPLSLSSRSLELNFCRQPVDEKKTEYDVETLLAQGEVEINYLNQFHLEAHRALYRKESEVATKTSKKEFQGMITAYPKDEKEPCRLSYAGQEIVSDTMDVDLVHAKLSLSHPRGHLSSSLTEGAAPLRFQSDYLYWDHAKQLITLKGAIFLEEDSIGKVETQDELQLTVGEADGRSVLNRIRAQGLSSLTYRDARDTVHHLTAHGPIQIDRTELRALVESPNKGGRVEVADQLCYEGDTFTIFADHASIDYALTGKQMTPSVVTLKGNVRLSSPETAEHVRLGSADRLSYSATTRTFILSADPGKKVLFWDDVQGVHLSAPEVHITVDPKTGEQQVKGVGAVQFSFTSDEQTKMQQIFSQLQRSP